MLVSKCLLEHYCQKRSWRKISEKYGIHYSKIYQINSKIQKTALIQELFEYFIGKGILVYYDKNLKQANIQQPNIEKSLSMLDSLRL